MKLCCIYIFIAAFLFNSCKLNTWPDNKSAINDMVKKYPELYGKGMIGNYKPVRTLDDNVDSIKMQLLEADHGDEQIVVFSNQKGQAYAVPFPDNDDRSYWQFYDDPVPHTPSDRQFDSEMKIAFKRLAIRGNLNSEIYNDLMVSLIQCRPVFFADTVKRKNGILQSNFSDSCAVISKRNFQNMFTINVLSYRYFNSYDDIPHNRFFKIIGNEEWERGNKGVVVYRKPCVVKPVYL